MEDQMSSGNKTGSIMIVSTSSNIFRVLFEGTTVNEIGRNYLEGRLNEDQTNMVLEALKDVMDRMDDEA